MAKFTNFYFSALALLSGVLGLGAIVASSSMLSELGLADDPTVVTVYQRFGITILPFAVLFWHLKGHEARATRVVLSSVALMLYGGLGIATFLGMRNQVLTGATVPLVVESVVSLLGVVVLITTLSNETREKTGSLPK